MEKLRVVDLDEERKARERQEKLADLQSKLLTTKEGATAACVSNAILIIGHDPVLAGIGAFDEFTNQHVLTRAAPCPLGTDGLPGPYPRPWSQADVSHVQSYIQRAHAKGMNRQDTEDAMVAVAATNRFHPVRDWLATLRWDGKSRLHQWLTMAFGALPTVEREGNVIEDNAKYIDSIGTNFLIAAVRRVRRPGCKFDHMLVLEGIQDMGKSSAIKCLFGPQWFTDSLPSKLESRDAALGLQGAWVVEFAEIEQIIRAEVEVIKAFLSRAVDRFRAPYGRNFLSYPRQCVLVGTTNDTDYLRDPTGNRRFWPVACTMVDLTWIEANREQLWAEAAQREEWGETHWYVDAAAARRAAEIQDDRAQGDVWESRVLAAVAGLRRAMVPEILTTTLSIPLHQQTRREQMRVAAILRRMGWTSGRSRVDGEVTRYWDAPKPKPAASA